MMRGVRKDQVSSFGIESIVMFAARSRAQVKWLMRSASSSENVTPT